jgi:GWxTD domain-containing protein
MKNKYWLSGSLLIFLLLGAVGCGISSRANLDPESRDFYETARLIMTNQEKAIFNHLPDAESRREFIEDFWLKRDPDPDTEENEFKDEFFARIEYANSHFKEGMPGWKTDRGRIYIHFGFPDKIDSYPFVNRPDIKGFLQWVYYRFGFAVRFIDRRGDNSYLLDPYSGIIGSLFDAMERAKFGIAFDNENEMTQKYLDFDLKYDRDKKEIIVSLPVEKLTFTAEEEILKADFDFRFYFYEKKGLEKIEYNETRPFEIEEKKLVKMDEITFTFPYDLQPGKYYVDVVIVGRPDIGKTRKIFEIKS